MTVSENWAKILKYFPYRMKRDAALVASKFLNLTSLLQLKADAGRGVSLGFCDWLTKDLDKLIDDSLKNH